MVVTNEVAIKSKNMTFNTHNTITNLGFLAFGEFRKYGEYLLVGTSRELQVEGVTDLASFHSAYKTNITDYNFDVSKGTLYVTRTAEIYSSTGFNLTEMGLSYKGLHDGIVNYITIKDQNNLPDSIVIDANEPVSISIKMCFNMTGSKLFFTKGNNILIQAILGVKSIDKTKMFFVRGGNVIHNDTAVDGVVIDENYPEKIQAICNVTTSINGSTINTIFHFETGEIDITNSGNIYELVLILEGAGVARYEYLTAKEETVEDDYVCPSNGAIDFNFHINNIVYVQDVTDSIVVDTPNVIHTAYNFGYGVEKAFDENINATTPCFLSSDSKKVGFLVSGRLLLFKDEGFRLNKLDTSNFTSRENVINIVITNDYLFTIYELNDAIKFDCYKINEDDISVKTVDDTSLPVVFGSGNIKKMDICSDDSGFRVGVICGENNYGYVIKYNIDQDGNLTYNSYVDSYLANCINVFAMSKYEENTISQIVFMTNNYNNQNLYKITNLSGDILKSSTAQTLGAAMIYDVVKYLKTNVAIIAIKSDGSSAGLFPDNFTRFNIVNENVEQIAFDNQMRNSFCITKSGQIKIMHSNNMNSFVSIVNGFPSQYIPIQNIQNIIFLYDCALVFCNTLGGKAYVVQLPRLASSIHGLTAEHIYHIKSKVANHPGALGNVNKVKAKFLINITEA